MFGDSYMPELRRRISMNPRGLGRGGGASVPIRAAAKWWRLPGPLPSTLPVCLPSLQEQATGSLPLGLENASHRTDGFRSSF